MSLLVHYKYPVIVQKNFDRILNFRLIRFRKVQLIFPTEMSSNPRFGDDLTHKSASQRAADQVC